jgi:hypothetical protein
MRAIYNAEVEEQPHAFASARTIIDSLNKDRDGKYQIVWKKFLRTESRDRDAGAALYFFGEQHGYSPSMLSIITRDSAVELTFEGSGDFVKKMVDDVSRVPKIKLH